MKKSTKKKGFKLPKYKFGGKELEEVGLGLADNAITTVTGGAGANVITQDQYNDTKIGRSIGETEALKESMDSMAPIAKMYNKFDTSPKKTGYNKEQQALYDQAQPIAKMGSSLGEMWAGKGMSSMANKPGTQAQIDAGQNPTGQGQNMFGNIMLSFGNSMMTGPTQNNNIAYQQNDPNITGSNSYGMKQQNPYFKHGGAFNLMHPLNNPNFNMPMFPMGGNMEFGGNAQLEKQENTLNPDGTTTQFNLPPHENQSPEEGAILDPGTLIFSDELKPKGSKETFAILNKSNNTDKEDKVLDNPSSNALAKKTAQLMKDAKHKQSLKLFQEQEMLKQSKANNYIKRLGGVMQFPKGGKVDAMGFPIDATGRRLTSAEQLGYSRPGYTYGNSTMQGVSGANTGALTGLVNPGLLNAGGNPNMGKTLEPFSYTAGQTGPDGRPISYNDAFNSYLSTQTDAYGRPLKQKLGGMMPKYINGGKSTAKLQEMNSPEPELMPYNYNAENSLVWAEQPTDDLRRNYNDPYRFKGMDDSNGGNGGNNMNWKGALGQAGMWAANNAGELAYLMEQGKKYDTQKEYAYNPTLLDPTASLRDADIMAKTAAYDLADKASGHSGNYLTNRIALATAMTLNKDKIRREYANANAGISNDAQLTNIKGKYMVDDINAKNKGAALNQYYKSIERMGTNTAQAGKDNKASKMDQDTLDLMRESFSDPAFKAMLAEYRAKKTGKK